MHTEARNNNIAALQSMINSGQHNLDRSNEPNTQYMLYPVPLHSAARYGRTEAVQALLDGGADVNIGMSGPLGSCDLNTPLHVATRYNHINTVKVSL